MANIFEYDVFLSFASSDEEIVRPIWQELSLNGLRVFWSDAALKEKLGESWFDAIQASLERSRHFLLICSLASMSSKWVQREYKAFYNYFYKPGLRRLIPLMVDGFQDSQLPVFLKELQASDLRSQDSIKQIIRLFGGTDVEELKDALVQKEEELQQLRLQREIIESELASARQEIGCLREASAEIAPMSTELPIPVPGLREIVSTALKEVIANEASSWGSVYIADANSRRIFGKLRRQLATSSIPEVVTILESFLSDSDSLMRWKAMRFLLYLGYSHSKRIRDFWEKEPVLLVRKIVFEAVKKLPERDAQDLLLDMATMDDGNQIRSVALGELQSYFNGSGRQRILSTFMNSLSDDDGGVRHMALDKLLENRASEAIEKARGMILRDPDNSVRVSAAELLAGIGPLEAFDDLAAAFSQQLVNAYVLNNCLAKYRSRFGQSALLERLATIGPSKEAEEIKKAILTTA